MKKKIIIIGGGAAGFFSAINIAELTQSKFDIEIWEKSLRPLQKLRISGGGRCNFTNVEENQVRFSKNYPRGHKEILKLLKTFSNQDMVEWLENKGVSTKYEATGKYFPQSNSSDSIIFLFEQLIKKFNIQLKLSHGLSKVEKQDQKWILNEQTDCDFLVFTPGGSLSMWAILEGLGLEIINPIPSLFTFKVKNPIVDLAGVSISDVQIFDAQDKKMKCDGDFLFTHQGCSGPVVLKYSAFYARELEKCLYNTKLKVNFIGLNEQIAFEDLKKFKSLNSTKKIKNEKPFSAIPKRFWEYLLVECEIDMAKSFQEITDKSLRKIALKLTQFELQIVGKVTNKEEFVTAGGVSRSEINFDTMQSKLYDNLFLAGEIIDIDGITGGFNFQNCWSGAFVLAKYFQSIS